MAFFPSSPVFLISDFLSFNGPLCRYHDEKKSIQHGKVLLTVHRAAVLEQRATRADRWGTIGPVEDDQKSNLKIGDSFPFKGSNQINESRQQKGLVSREITPVSRGQRYTVSSQQR